MSDRPGLGIALMLAAWFLFSLVDTSVKWLVIAGLPAIQMAFMRYFVHFLISAANMLRGGVSRGNFAVRHPFLMSLRAVLLVSGTAANFIVLNYLPLTITSAIMFFSPILVCLLSWPLLGERVGPWRWFAIVMGFAGVMVIIRPFGETFSWWALLPLYNSLALALYSILTRKLAGKERVETMQFYMGAIGSVLLLPFAIAQWQSPSSGTDWLLFLALGMWGWGGHEMLTRAHGMAPASTLMPFTYSFIIYLSISSYLVFNHLPNGWTILGAVIIAGSGLLIWAREKRL